jgi:hypothetical protein
MNHDIVIAKLEAFMKQRDSNILGYFVVREKTADVKEDTCWRRSLAFNIGECMVRCVGDKRGRKHGCSYATQ